MKKTILLLTALLLHIIAQGQQLIFEKNFGTAISEAGASIDKTTDKGFIIAGSIGDWTSGEFDIYLVKTDSIGNQQWTSSIGSANKQEANSVRQTTDGGYIIAGYSYVNSGVEEEIYLIKTDSAGNLQWSKTFGSPHNDRGTCVQQTTDGGYIVSGYYYASVSDYDAYLIKTDANGNQQWAKNIGGGIMGDLGNSVKQTGDGGYILAGWSANFSVAGDAYLVKTDADGNKQWEKTLGNANDAEQAYSVELTNDGGYIVTGETYISGAGYPDVYVAKTDTNGNEQWSKIIGSMIADEKTYSVIQALDSSYILAGVDYGSSGTALLIKLDGNGNTIWSKRFGGTETTGLSAVIEASSKEYVVAGTTLSFGASMGDAYLAKIKDTTIYNGISLLKFNEDIDISFSPNPFSHSANLRITNTYEWTNGNLQFQMYDVLGRVVKTTNIKQPTTNIERNGFPAGIYFYKINNDKKEIIGSGKVVIE